MSSLSNVFNLRRDFGLLLAALSCFNHWITWKEKKADVQRIIRELWLNFTSTGLNIWSFSLVQLQSRTFDNIPRSSVESGGRAVAPFPALPLLTDILSHREVSSLSDGCIASHQPQYEHLSAVRGLRLDEMMAFISWRNPARYNGIRSACEVGRLSDSGWLWGFSHNKVWSVSNWALTVPVI